MQNIIIALQKGSDLHSLTLESHFVVSDTRDFETLGVTIS